MIESSKGRSGEAFFTITVRLASTSTVVRSGAVSIATIMACTLSCDHRAVDGAVGAKFLAAFKEFVDEPLTMML